LAERGAKHVNVDLLRWFFEPATLDSEAQAFLERGMALAMEWATQGLVVPHVSQTIDSTVEAINAGLQSLKADRGILGKVAVIVDRDLAAGKDRAVGGGQGDRAVGGANPVRQDQPATGCRAGGGVPGVPRSLDYG